MKTKRYIRTIIAMLMLLLYGAAEVWADDITICVEKSDGTFATLTGSGGDVNDGITGGSVSVAISERDVTLTVTPASDYKIKKDLIVVEKMVNPGRSSAPRRAPGLGTFVLSGSPGWVTVTTTYTFTIPEEYDGAYVTATFVSDEANLITSLEEITEANGHYKLARDINASSYKGFSSPFTGTFDGNGFTISNLGHALFNTVDGGVVKNVILDDVSISGGTNTNVGAICGDAIGDSRIYNCGVLATGSMVDKDDDGYDYISSCSSTISGSDYVGSIVGLLDGSSRVINCFSYANVSGGTHAGGIVGYNNVATTANNLQTMVMNCMFYGEVSGGSIAPIYNGEIITNDGDANGVNNFNYFRLESAYIQNTTITKVYNCALGAETRFLQRFEFFRHLLNSNRELAAWWATGSAANKDKMMKWVLEPTQIGTTTPYPILKTPDKYPSVVNYTPSETAYDESNRNKGGKLTSEGTNGKLSVTISMGTNTGSTPFSEPSSADFKPGETGTFDLTITDKDYEHFNFNYGKVQLPYYNDYCTGNYTENRVVTGWKITSITGGTAGSYTTGEDVTTDDKGNIITPYNFADRKCKNKDLYLVSGRVFNQGAYWDVPEGVTDITIEPYWGKAVYLSDAYWDVTYKNGTGEGTKEGTANDAMTTTANVPSVGGGSGQHYENGKKYNLVTHSRDDANGQTVYTSMGNAIKSDGTGLALFQGETTSGRTVYDYAVVLVGNYHHNANPDANLSKPYTVTSIDLDGDNEPDYSLMLRFNGRRGVHPVRYDFLNLIGLGMAQKTTGGTGSYNLGIMQPYAWFEVTNTALFRVTQFEYSPANRVQKPIILQGGVIEQWVTQQDNAGDKVSYFHVGGNVWFKEFHRGSHQDNTNKSTPHPPVSVTGGDYDKFYLTGLYQSQATIYDDNAECYINGGRFGEVAGAGMEGIGTSDGKGNIFWSIDNADIKEFYGGGINAAKPVHGNIHTIINNSHVDRFCGGPKFGDMESGRTVTTTASKCTFGTYFGAGYGGNSYNRQAPRNHNNILNFPHDDKGNPSAGNDASWNAWLARFYKQEYNATYKGVSTQFDYQFLPMSSNTENVARIFVEYVGFSLATCRNVTSSLTECNITGNFYGGGSLGKVAGDVTSELHSCTVNGSVFGSGYSASLPTVEVMDIGFKTGEEPYYYEELGTYRKGVFPATTTYTWQQGNAISINTTDHILYTTEDLSDLGTVSGHVTLNVTGNTLVEGKIFDKNGVVTGQTGGVFGGGDESKVTGADKTVTVNIHQTGTTVGHYINNVFGGGNMGDVASEVQVTIEGTSSIKNDVYGGGNLADVGGSVTLNMKGGTVDHDVYGGGALANTNIGNATNYGTDSETISSTSTKTTSVNITGGTVNGNVYGGGLGRQASGDPGTPATYVAPVEAKVYGNVVVNIGAAPEAPSTTPTGNATFNGSVYGCNNLNGTPKGDVVVNIYKTAHTTGDTNNQYPSGITTLDGLNSLSNDDNRFAIKAVYGGGNLAHYTPIAPTGTNPAHSTTVHVYGCSENTIKTVYGGGNAADVGTTTVGEVAGVPANTNVIIEGGRFDVVFGGGNGFSETNNHSNPSEPNYNPGANIYGTATTEIYGGLFNQVFGGSNQYGNVTVTDFTIDKQQCDLLIKESFGGANEADIEGDVTTTLACSTDPPEIGTFYGGSNKANINGNVTLNVEGGTYTDIFGGSKGVADDPATDDDESISANISGDVTLNLYGGTMDNAFGGSDVKGLIGGKITVNMLDRGNCPLVVHNIYGGGREAEYRPTTPGAYPEVNLIHGTVSKKAVTNGDNTTYTGGNVFGGGKGAGATVTSNPTVYVGYNSSMSPLVTSLLPENTQFNTANVSVEGNVYGGGDLAAVTGSTSVTLQQHTAEGFTSESTVDYDMYGGGNKADVTGSVTVSLTGGSVRDVYGGGALANTNTDQTTNIGTDEAPAHHSTTVTVTGGTARDVYGGGLGCQAVEDDPNTTDVDESVSAVAALVNGAVTVTVSGGKATNVFGCNNVNGAPQSTVTVNVTGTDSPTASANYAISYVYGGGNVANYTGTPVVTVTGSSYVENVFGGGNEASVGGTNVTINTTANTGETTNSGISNVFGGGNRAGVTGNASVSMTGGNVTTAIYGGCNASGTIGGDATVTLNGGQVGTSETHAAVFGGGYGNATYVAGNVEVIIGSSETTTSGEEPNQTTTTSYSGTAVVYGDVYGGGAQGHVNAEKNETPSATEPTYQADKTTTVNLYKGTIHGDVYGGGLGDATHAAYVGGSVNVNLYETVFDITTTTSGDITYANSGRIFGGNNEKGTPKGHITVHVFNTETSINTSFGYDLAAVFGGGNKADYEPSTATDYAEVIIEGCDETSIKDVYGGGNAAAVPETKVWILGSKIIENVFGGGNGELGPAHAAHVGVHRASASTTSPYPEGTTGETYVYLIGGTITNVYGGSNSNGDIIGGSHIQMPISLVYTESHPAAPTPSSCTLHTTNIYGGGKNADMSGGANIALGCMPDAWIDEIYAGAQAADIAGDVSLTITSGKFQRVFGGNKDSGMLKGSITVNIEETGDCDVPIVIGELYAGGNLAGYSIYGYDNNGDPIEDEAHKVTGAPYDNPKLNVRAFTSIGAIYGGGYSALMVGSPTIDINVVKGSHADDETLHNGTGNTFPAGETEGVTSESTLSLRYPAHTKGEIGAIGNVYGGGNLANVIGNTAINIGTATEVGFVTEPIHLRPNSSAPLQQTNGFYVVDVQGANITENVYGGGNDADIVGNTTITIGTVNLTGTDKFGTNVGADVYGGGKGKNTTVTGDVAVNIGTNASGTAVGYATIGGDVYGGSAFGAVNATCTKDDSGNVTAYAASFGKTTQVNLYGGTVTGNLFGGGLGQTSPSDIVAKNFGNTAVRMEGGRVGVAVYGGANANGVLKGDSKVTITGGTVGTDPGEGTLQDVVFGGGKGQPTLVEGSVEVNIGPMTTGETPEPTGSATIWGNVYGGSALGNVNAYLTGSPAALTASTDKTTHVNLYDGTIHGDLFGGGLGDNTTDAEVAANVYGPVVVTTKGGTANNVFGSNNLYGAPQNTVRVNIDGGEFSGSVYGGGNLAAYSANQTLTIAMSGGTVTNDVFGGGLGTSAQVTGNTSVTVSGGGVTNSIYGGGSAANLTGNAEVTVSGGSAKTVYGGGNVADVSGNATVNITGGTLSGTAFDGVTAAVFGGGLGNTTKVGGTVTVNIGTRTGDAAPYTYGGTAEITGDIYGASAKGKVNTTDGTSQTTDATTNVNLYGGTITGDIYGGGLGDATNAADVYGPVTVKTAGEGSAGNVFGCNNFNGAPQSTVAVNIGGGTFAHNVYGGGNLAAYTGTPTVTVSGGTATNVFGGGLGSTAIVTGMPSVTISGGTVTNNVYGGGSLAKVAGSTSVTISGTAMVNNDVFGGGNLADVTQNVSVSVTGGKVINDVYGGGALANTNTDNWDETANSGAGDWKVTSSTSGDYYASVKHLKATESIVTGYYTESGGIYTQISAADTKAENNVTYYKKLDSKYTAEIYDIAANGTAYKTSVSVTGGTVGNVYGGGLGRLYKAASGTDSEITAVSAMVYGDVTVTVGDGTRAGSAVFTDIREASARNSSVTGRVFGCNNINGTPKGSVTVTINSSRRSDGGDPVLKQFEIQGVYGGGNLANYEPQTYDHDTEFGQSTKVIINGCDVTSISKVYGGGNAATVPFTNVTINSVFEIGYVFGGGNGGDMIYKNGEWIDNPGANVTYYTNVLLKGGTIGQAFGGSDSKGTTGGSDIKQQAGTSSCPLHIVNLYGAGNGELASSDGDITMDVSACGAYSEIQNVFGGSYKADIRGSVTLNIKSGIFTSVYGGNDRKGSIGGNITVNIEEMDNCDKPIIIQNLYGGCYQTEYPGANAKYKDGDELKTFTRGKLTVNVRSCTRIDRIFGGSEEGLVNGDTEVNINMVKGSMSGQGGVVLPSYYGDVGAVIPSNITVTNKTGGYVVVYGLVTNADVLDDPTKERSSVVGYYTKEVTYTQIEDPDATAVEGTTYYQRVEPTLSDYYPVAPEMVTDVSGFYTKEDTYTLVGPGGKAVEGVTYYKESGGVYTKVDGLSVGDDVSTYYTKGYTFQSASNPAVSGVTYYRLIYNYSSVSVTVGETVVNGYYTRAESDPAPASGLAVAGTTYYKAAVIGKIADEIGNIGLVYGGGNIGKVDGSTVVNIGTETILTYSSSSEPIHLGTKDTDYTYNSTTGLWETPVLGAHVTGDVFGGCNNAVVTRNSTVNICAKEKDDDSGDYEIVTPGTSNVIIDGTEYPYGVFGGGNYGVVNGDCKVYLGAGKVNQSIYGGGCIADVKGNTKVTMLGGYVYDGVYGGGLRGSVGTFERVLPTGHASHDGCVGGKPDVFASGTGKCTVVVSGGQVGPTAAAQNGMNAAEIVDVGFVFGAGRGDVENPEVDKDADFHCYVNETDVTISDDAFIMASVYGGGENGRVRNNTLVKIQGGQIGCGNGQIGEDGKPKPYIESQFIDPTETPVTSENALAECSYWPYGRNKGTTEAPEWVYEPYDPYADDAPSLYPGGSTEHPSDGKTYYGCVFGGGSGYFPYEKTKSGDVVTDYDWLRSAGLVEGNTEVQITGGHILTNVYGGNEYTDVLGTCTVTMTGGTIGVPRTLAQIAAHPVTCYLFGAGKGDPRVHFNTWTNVQETKVEVTGGIIYGSVFGGGEDGHILGNAEVNISGSAQIGTWGTSYVDGNVFGGGRGFSGEALTAGSVGGNIDVNITGGTMLGSVYGGGRLAATGIPFTAPTDPAYGQLKEDEGDNKYGYITVNISGGTIGNDLEFVPVPYEIKTEEGLNTWKTSNHIPNTEFYYGKDDKDQDLYLLRHTKGGNVFGGSMGKLTMLDGVTYNPLWPKLGIVKSTKVNIYGNAKIKGNVYGGGEFSMTRGDTYVTVGGVLGDDDNTTVTSTSSDKPTIKRNIYGGGYGSVDRTPTTITAEGFEHEEYTFIPMQMAGIVCGDSHINIAGGNVEKNVYGGGELATVGLPDFAKAKNEKHEGTGTFELSWPYNLEFIRYYNINDPNSPIGGTTHINITGGRIGLTGKDYMGSTTIAETEKNNRREDNGDIYGGGKGVAGGRYDYAFCANVKETEITINYDKQATKEATPTNYTDNLALGCVAGSVYGGGENGHVIEDTHVHLNNGLIGHAIYGGGKGKDKYSKDLNKTIGTGSYTTNVYCITAGKVYGNTTVEMTGGYVVRNIYGGGNLASVGKGNYASGSDDYYPNGYGEKLEGKLWTTTATEGNPDNAWHFLNSGKSTVKITGGTVGTADGEKDDLPYGNVYGGCRGQAAAEVMGIDNNPDIYLGYVNETEVTIGDDSGGPKIYGSVYGGGQDGHVRRETSVTINDGEIGLEHTAANITAVGVKDKNNNDVDLNHYKWKHRGNVYGGGSGIGQYSFDYDGDGNTNGTNLSYGSYTVNEKGASSSAGHVTHKTSVTIKGGTIHRNVYGGGSLASVCPPYYDPANPLNVVGSDGKSQGEGKESRTKVDISGGIIGCATDNTAGYGGNVYGASRGESAEDINSNYYALCTQTETSILPHDSDRSKDAQIAGNVYGGGELGKVLQNTEVYLTGGSIGHDAYGGGRGSATVAADVGGDATVELNKDVPSSAKGCIVRRIFGCNDLNGTPRGDVLVHVYGTQHPDKDVINQKYAKFHNLTGYSITKYDELITLAETTYNISSKSYGSTYTTDKTTLTGSGDNATKEAALKRIIFAVERAELESYAESLGLSSEISSYQATLDGESASDSEKEKALAGMRNVVSNKKYDVEAVYGGGDLALYQPYGPLANGKDEDYKNTTKKTQVIIEGCDLTSIKQVYGSGNAASTPACSVTVYGTHEIDELFGGGNGNDPYFNESDSKWYENPGANVGYYDYTYYLKSGTDYDAATHGAGTSDNPYKAIEKDDAANKDLRQAHYKYGEGSATTNIYGGRIHNVYGGSNKKGNISTIALSTYDTSTDCELIIDNSYGAGKDADIDGEARVNLGCVDYMARLVGGATNADVNSDVHLVVTNGNYGQVFGGNDTKGHIYGAITVTIKEESCKPIIIGELYATGYGAGAPYSIYGYYDTKTTDAEGKAIFEPRTRAKFVADSLAAIANVPDKTDKVAIDEALMVAGLYGFPKRDPHILVVSASRIDEIYGGGYQALTIGNPHINVNMEQGKVLAKYADANKDDVTDVAFTQGEHTSLDKLGNPYTDKEGNIYKYWVDHIDASGDAYLKIGTIGKVFGGGNMANIWGDTHVEIGTGKYHNESGEEENLGRNAAFITGSVYGGGNMGDVGEFNVADAAYNTAHPSATLPIGKPYECVYGGKCHVTISNGEIGPDNMQMVQYNNDGTIKLGADDNPLPPVDLGHVFGGSQGTNLPVGANQAYVDSTEVIINGTAFVKGSVYGGGENGHVLHNTGVKIGGNCQIGGGNILLTDADGKITVNQGINRRYTDKEWENGRLFVVGDPVFYNTEGETPVLKTLTTEEATLRTEVGDKYYTSSLPECASWLYGKEIDDNGKVVTTTHHAPYDKFANYASGDKGEYPTIPDGATSNTTDSGRRVASNGATFYGMVFGGGSGYFPYAPGQWLNTAGKVEGDTWVVVTGGHILTNLYGGNEMTDVGGHAHVIMKGGTLGVPRTLAEIDNNPVTCYVFGAGKGEGRAFLNETTNVQQATVDVQGGWVYGSVFGGAEDGHVLGDVKMRISGTAVTNTTTYNNIYSGNATKIGTWGTSYVDGNIFGGGRGYDGHNQYAGSVGGNVDIAISGGTMLGSIYGGGRLGSVGINSSGAEIADVAAVKYTADEIAAAVDGEPAYGKTTDDVKIPAVNHGHITIDISGGTIGNTNEFKYIAPTVTGADLTTATTYMPKTLLESTSTTDKTNNRLSHTKGGNVFAGGMGRRLMLDNVTPLPNWTELGKVKSTKLTIGGTVWIMGNVYGGGEFGAVTGTHATKNTQNEDINVGTEILINGGTIGTEITLTTPIQEETIPVPESYPESGNSDVMYTFGSVFGGGYGTSEEIDNVTQSEHAYRLGALVSGNSTVRMSGGRVRASVYGGGELAAVGGNTDVTISGGKIGRNEVYGKDEIYDTEKNTTNPGYVKFGGATMGNVFGGGKGDDSHTLVGVVKGNTNVTINAGAVEGEPFIYHNVYGGGANGSVGTFSFSDGVTGFQSLIPKGIPLDWTEGTGLATVNIKGGTIGISGRDNGMVNGSSRGNVAKPIQTIMGGPDTYIPKDPYDKMAWVERSIVNIGETGTTGPHIKGSVYGGGENGHVFTHATVNVKSGIIGIVPKTGETQDPWLDFGTPTINEKAWITRGNVYGAGCGTDTYTGDDKKEHYNEWAGCVIGNTDVNISGGHIAQSVYGGGSMGSVGRIVENTQYPLKHEDVTDGFALSWPYEFKYDLLTVEDPVEKTHETGKTTVNITGGLIGTTGSDNGDVFGGSRGEAGPRYDMAKLANVRKTEVNINYTSTPTDDKLAIVENIEDGKAKFSLRVKDDDVEAITGSVYGGAENGHVNEDTKVTITNGLIGHAVYGGGKGKGKYEVELINWKDSRITEETLLAWKGKPLSEILDEYKHPVPIYSVTAGRVFGNTTIEMKGGHVLRNIYGGGNMGSVGKGNYAGGKDDYSYYAIPGLLFSGYGETLDGNLWDNVSDNSKAFLSSGKTNVSITGGTVGFMVTPSTDVIPLEGAATTFNDYEDKAKLVKVLSKDDLPTGNIFGGCRGEAPPNVSNNLSPRYYYCPEFYAGYVNETDVEIGDATADATGGPRIYGSVYGGGQDGHVRRSTNVTINKGEIGIPYNTDYQDLLGITDLDNPQWLHRGNVYGSGSGIGKYTDKDASGQEIEFFSTSSGSVTGSTTVTVNNGITGEAGSTTGTVYTPGNVIYRNVYGGGSLASVGPPKIPASRPDDALLRDDSEEGKSTIGKQSTNTVAISGTVGAINGYNEMYGGEVYGGSRGEPLNHESYPNFAEFATSVWTKVHIKNGARIMGNVFGGGDSGKVKKDTDVKIGGE